jgi:hypothetical protein
MRLSPWLFMSLMALTAAAAAPPATSIRAVFVGIDDYLYSSTKVQGAGFNDLHGAVGDAERMKAALRSAYHLDLDTSVAGQCRSENAVSTTLTNNCADRTSIIAALEHQIDASRPGDTLIFYYAGHGSQFIDDQVFDQASGYNDTIMPTDARKPGAASGADILDREILGIVNRATMRGVNVVTIFDSCNSGTATRDLFIDGVSRSAPPLRASGTNRPVDAAVTGDSQGSSPQDSGYRVHFAAAADGESAMESGGVGVRAGVFTTALAATLVEMPHATFADIDAEARLKVEESGHAQQHPQASGELRATLGGAAASAVLLDATGSATVVTLQGGKLSGVTEGSTYALFASTSDALRADARPLASGRVTTVDNSLATLKLDQPASQTLPQRLVARETAHAFGQQFVLVRNQVQSAEGRANVARAIAGLPVARIAEPAQLVIASKAPNDSTVNLYAQDGRLLAELGSPGAAEFTRVLGKELEKVARVQALLALRTDPAAAESRFCIATGTYDPYDCPVSSAPANGKPATAALKGPSSERRLNAGKAAQVTVLNASDRKRYIYVLGIDADYSVTLLLPADRGVDAALGPHQPLQRSDVVPDSPGRYRFVTIATDAPINAQALEQSRSGARDLGRCTSALERALCSAQDGTRDLSTPRVGAWTATISTALVK